MASLARPENTMSAIADRFDILQKLESRKVHLVSLGCPKNRVDSELMVGLMQGKGHTLTDDPSEADILVVNTCAFIESAKEESIDTILELSDYKAARPGTKLIVTGCMAQRYSDQLVAEMPEVDYFLGTNEFKRINQAIDGALPDRAWVSYGSSLYTSDEERINSIRGGSAYVKIAEGCNRTCSFCIIPKIRGKQRSRTMADIVREVEILAASGVKEVNLIAQDLTSYGVDIDLKDGLSDLLDRLNPISGVEWIRLHYAYPWGFNDRLIAHFSPGSKVIPYVDMPLQHVSDPMLKAMRRATRRKSQEEVISKLREIPGMVLRTVFITGFPGETNEDFDQLHQWVKDVQFDRVGVFTYSKEEGTSSFDLTEEVPAELAEERRDILMETQRSISRTRNEALIGQTLKVLVDGVSEEHEFVFEGRWYGQAIDIDGVVFLSYEDGADPVMAGEFVTVEVDDATEYDLKGIVQA
jgi:ribosomal protein S12 methylthiotransferase